MADKAALLNAETVAVPVYGSEAGAEGKSLLAQDAVTPGTSNDFNVIFAIFSTAVGATLLVLPFDFHEAGLVFSVCAVLFVYCVNTYTCTLMPELGKDISMVQSKLLASFGVSVERGVMASSIVILLCVMMLYNILITDGIMKFAQLEVDDMDYRPFIASGVVCGVFFVGLLKSLSPLFKLASYAFVIPFFWVFFVVFESVRELRHPTCKVDPKVKPHFYVDVAHAPGLVSTLHLSICIHNVILNYLSEARNQQHNKRNVAAAYGIAATLYAVPSTLAAYAFRHCDLPGNFVNPFKSILASAVRGSVIALICVLYPVLLFLSRTQALSLYFKDADMPPLLARIGANAVVLILTALPSALNLPIADVAAMAGVACSLWVVFIPVCLYIAHRRRTNTASKAFYISHGVLLVYGIALIVLTVRGVFGK